MNYHIVILAFSASDFQTIIFYPALPQFKFFLFFFGVKLMGLFIVDIVDMLHLPSFPYMIP